MHSTCSARPCACTRESGSRQLLVLHRRDVSHRRRQKPLASLLAASIASACAAIFCASALHAQTAPSALDDVSPWTGSRPEDLTIGLVTFGPGDDVYNYFGHNAVVVQDRALG